jgi:PAS domain S-box-containing protein
LITFENQKLQRLSTILEKVPDMIFSVGMEGKIGYVNERVTSVLGFGVDSLVHGDFYSLLVPPSRPLILRLIGDSQAAAAIAAPKSTRSNAVSTSVSSVSSGRSTSPSEER